MFKSLKWSYAAIALVSGGIVVSQIGLSAVFGVVFQYDFRFLTATLALLGLGAGGIFVFAFFQKIGYALSKYIMVTSGLYLVTAILPFIFIRGTFPSPENETNTLLVVSMLASALNFFFGGAFVSMLFAERKETMHTLYFFDLFGAAFGGIIALLVMNAWGLYSTPFLLFGLGAAAFITCWTRYIKIVPKPYTVLVLVGIVAASIFISRTSFRVRCVPPDAGPVLERSNSFSHVTIYAIEKTPQYVKLKAKINCSVRAFGYIADKPDDLRKRLDNFSLMPFLLSDISKILIIGSGVGVDADRALVSGSKDITAVEINPLLIELSKTFPRNKGVSAYEYPQVKTVIEEAREYVSSDTSAYGLILIAFTKNFGRPVGTQLFVPKHLYTLEAFEQYIDRLAPAGTLVLVDRQPFTQQYVKTLTEIGVKRGFAPEDHLMILSGPGDDLERPETLEVVLFKKNGFSADDRQKALSLTAKYGGVVRYIPAEITSAASRNVLTDDKPFLWDAPMTGSYLIPTQKILTHFNIAIKWSIAFSVIGLILFFWKMGWAPRNIAVSSFFIGISVGFAALEFAIINKLTLLLGNPVYAHAVILSSFLLFGGVGSLVSSRPGIAAVPKRVGLAIAGVMLFYFLALDRVLALFISSPIVLKTIAVTILILPAGFLSGMLFPIGLKKVGERGAALVPWAWGIDSLAFVTTGLAVSFAVIFYGIKIMFVMGALGYALAAAVSRRLE